METYNQLISTGFAVHRALNISPRLKQTIKNVIENTIRPKTNHLLADHPLNVFPKLGQNLKSINIVPRGTVQIEITLENLSVATYIYLLVGDGKILDHKTMDVI